MSSLWRPDTCLLSAQWASASLCLFYVVLRLIQRFVYGETDPRLPVHDGPIAFFVRLSIAALLAWMVFFAVLSLSRRMYGILSRRANAWMWISLLGLLIQVLLVP